MKASDHVLREDPAPGVARVVINRPEKRNSLDNEARFQLIAMLGDVLSDDGVRCVILAGAGGVFCSGSDLTTMDDLSPEAGLQRMRRSQQIPRMLARTDKGLIAAVEGFAVGIGAAMAVLCDTLIAGRSTRFGFPFTKIGLVPDFGLGETLAWRIGRSRARQVLLYGSWIDADEALRLGLADEVVDDEAVLDRALERAQELAALAPGGFRATKHLLACSLDELLDREAALQALCFQTDESAAGRALALSAQERSRRAGSDAAPGEDGPPDPGTE